ncbi:iron export ABC transporter permease subunit FetB [candidate division WOR-3 bacterium]|uniref:Iron export ABC transporter permease subunit FetB n=1 Tax=candidate division WOR-3 bacterium TaxID=2052148 RepID=A0A9D5K889_UNCW3|nr:iron export ABC transporter permease subunit FetB [candidate division WOR-3 bacterium]MBD3364082.1 iron export ABC transporter permease subunit FetB [candidate division WOR-3 bacterium]
MNADSLVDVLRAVADPSTTVQSYSAAQISVLSLGISLVFVVVSLIISFGLRLKMWKEILVATIRTILQLLLAGFVLAFVFRWNIWYVTLILLVVMIVIASFESIRRQKHKSAGLFFIVGFGLLASAAFSLVIVIAFVLNIKPWYEPQYLISMGGLVIGNSMTAAALVLNRMWGDMKLRQKEVESLLALGASPYQAAGASIRESVKMALIPTINAMMVVGIVKLPGIMTGQIMAGQPPASAIRYQIVVMFLILGAATITAAITALFGYKFYFTPAQQLKKNMFV